jgi:uncharacterized protein YjiS (DUF1127 family)
MTTEQLAALKEIAEKASITEHVEGCHDCAKITRQFRREFNPTTCLELLEEVERLREVERECLALDKLTDRVLKFDILEALKP